MVQWLGFRTSTAGGPGSIPGQRTKILQAVRCGQKKKKSPTVKKFIYPRASENDLSSDCFFHIILISILQDAVSRLISLGNTRLVFLTNFPVF